VLITDHLADFLALSPDRILDAVEAGGLEVTPACFPLNSYENRVYLVTLADGGRVIAKFYRPGRWSTAQILEEHRFLGELADAEIPTCRALPFRDGETIAVAHGITYALFEYRPGRPLGDLTDHALERVGMLAARIHAVGARRSFATRLRLTAESWVRRPAAELRAGPLLPPALGRRYQDAAERVAAAADARLARLRTLRLHGDLHRGNLLIHEGALQVLDLDDACTGPAVQDLWLMLSGPPLERARQLGVLLEAYERFRPFDRRELAALDVLPAMRRIHYAGWISRRWDDPLFRQTWPDYAEPAFWERELVDLEAIVRELSGPGHPLQPAATDSGGAVRSDPDDGWRPDLTPRDYFWDLDD